MNPKSFLRTGIFSKLPLPEGCEDVDCLLLWRKVLDEMLLDLTGKDYGDMVTAYKWFNSSPGDKDYYIDEDTGEEIEVDAYEEFIECCSLAEIPPDRVRDAANLAHKTFEKEIPRW